MTDGPHIWENLAGSSLGCAPCGISIWLCPDWAGMTGTSPALVGRLNKAAWKLEGEPDSSSLTKEV